MSDGSRFDKVSEALRELVALKDMKDGFGKEPFGDHNGARARADYDRRKPLAWQRAREVLAGGTRSAGERRYTVEQLEAYQSVFENLRRENHKHGNHDGQRACEFALESIRLYQMGVTHSATTSFMPTHRHAEGGLYEVLDASLQVQVGGKWMKGVRYRNAEGMEFVRDIYTFDARFTLESASPDRKATDG